jgi:chaperonin GroES
LDENLKEQTLLLESTDISSEIPEEILEKMGETVVTIYDEDLNSRSDWEEANDKWIKLAAQVVEEKSYPWNGAANVKYPLLSTAALQFHARAYPALIPDNTIVKTRVLGEDPDNSKFERASRVSKHMSYQLLEEDDDWQEDMDRMLYILPIVGIAYKKTYFSALKNKNVSKLVLPDDLVINYYATDYERAIKTHRMYQDENEVYELMKSEHYRDIDLEPAEGYAEHLGVEDEVIGLDEPSRSIIDEDGFNDQPYLILEQHTFWDLDNDGYKEPYIITVDYASQKVLRVVARWQADKVLANTKNEIIRITPTEYFTPYGFFPNPESKIYWQGFGSLLGPINSASNTILNQLIDAGTLANLQGGFLGKGIRSRGGKITFKPGHWEQLQTTGDDLRKNIYPLPIKEPSSVLFQLLGMLIQAGERLSSVKDIMVGENPGQNQPYATTVAVLEQGMKVFVGIYKRLYRSLTKEYKALFRLNSLYLDHNVYFNLLDSEKAEKAGAEDYNLQDMNIVPNADPSIVSEAHKMMKAESLLQKKASGLPLNTAEVTKRILLVEGHDDVELLLQPDPSAEDPKITLEKAKLAQDKELRLLEIQVQSQTTRFEALKDMAQAFALIAKAAETQQNADSTQFQTITSQLLEEYKAVTERAKVVQDGALQAQAQRQSPQEETA